MAKVKSILDQIQGSYGLKPEKLIISEVNWKFGIRAILRGDNLMCTGPTGTGKDLFVSSLSAALKREPVYIPFGATQDPRSSIVGNTHFDKAKGTFVQLSLFARAIQEPNTVIIMDELTRCHPEVQNLLMTVLDKDKRWLRIDEDPKTPTLKVADGVSFLSTANIGMEYLTTRGLDRAFLDRWSIIELPYLSAAQEQQNLTFTYPNLEVKDRNLIVDIVTATRIEVQKQMPQFDTALSTRTSQEMAALLLDGFTLHDAVAIKVYPLYSDDGPRQALRQLIQGFLPDLEGHDPDATPAAAATPF